MEADEALIAIKEIETRRVRGVDICGNCREKSGLQICVRWRNVISTHLEVYRQIEVIKGEKEEARNLLESLKTRNKSLGERK